MSEADYMDDCQHADRWDEENRPEHTHEVQIADRIVFRGSRAACWNFKRAKGGWVRETDQ